MMIKILQINQWNYKHIRRRCGGSDDENDDIHSSQKWNKRTTGWSIKTELMDRMSHVTNQFVNEMADNRDVYQAIWARTRRSFAQPQLKPPPTSNDGLNGGAYLIVSIDGEPVFTVIHRRMEAKPNEHQSLCY